MIDRARQKLMDLEARATATGELAPRVDSEGPSAISDGDASPALAAGVDAELDAMKKLLASGQPYGERSR